MNTKKELLSKITELESTTAKLKEQVSSMVGSGVGIPWVPKKGDTCWFIDSVGRIQCTQWVGDDIDKGRLTFGNVYRTKEQAQSTLGKRLAEVRILRRIAELNAEQGWAACFDGKQVNYCAASHQFGELERQSAWSYQALPVQYYGSELTIETVISELGDNYRLVLGVWE